MSKNDADCDRTPSMSICLDQKFTVPDTGSASISNPRRHCLLSQYLVVQRSAEEPAEISNGKAEAALAWLKRWRTLVAGGPGRHGREVYQRKTHHQNGDALWLQRQAETESNPQEGEARDGQEANRNAEAQKPAPEESNH